MKQTIDLFKSGIEFSNLAPEIMTKDLLKEYACNIKEANSHEQEVK